MKIVLAANNDAGCETLEYLLNTKNDIVGVLTKDTKKEPFKFLYDYVKEKGIPILTYSQVENIKPDILYSVYYHKRLTTNVINSARIALNFHGALLPDYKGCNSNIWTILNNEKESACTAHYLTENFDEGDIVGYERYKIDDDETGKSLYYKHTEHTGKLFRRIHEQIKRGEPLKMITKNAGGKYYNKTLPNNGIIDPSWSPQYIERFIRAFTFSPLPGAKDINGVEYK